MKEPIARSRELGARQGRPVGRWAGVSVSPTRYSPPVTHHFARALRAGGAFTLLELLTVVALVSILASLVLGTLGYVNRKGAQSKAEAEVAALASAIDSFYLDHGAYPEVGKLYFELVGVTNKAELNTNGKVYFEPTPGMVDNLSTGPFRDPWGTPYLYQTNESSKEFRNVGFFDLWTTAGGEKDPTLWIHN